MPQSAKCRCVRQGRRAATPFAIATVRRFYEDIGRKGGKATRDRHGVEFYESIGQKGGKVVKEKYGSDFYEEIGHKGGQKVKKLIAEAKKKLSEEKA